MSFVEYAISPLRPNDYNETFDFMQNHFRIQEPITRALEIAEGPYESRNANRLIVFIEHVESGLRSLLPSNAKVFKLLFVLTIAVLQSTKMTDAYCRTDLEERSSFYHANIMRDEIRSCDRCIRRCLSLHVNSKVQSTDNLVFSNGFLCDQHANIESSMPGPSNALNDRQTNLPGVMITAGQLLDTSSAGNSVFKLSQKISQAPRMTSKRRQTVLSQSWRTAKLFEKELENLKVEVEAALLQKEIENLHRRQLDSLNQQLNADLHFEDKVANDQIDKLAKERLNAIETRLRQMDFELKIPEIRIEQSSLCKLTFDSQYASGILPVPAKIAERVQDAEKFELQSFLLFGKSNLDPKRPKKFKVETVPPVIRGLTTEFMDLVHSDGDESD
ncbi:hypothetical protein M3Y96_00641200 [Aphelenchoides besseyi]|nr:hypothetical protein M3Y96_00641200 [Aphelenchoides besseyi]